MATYTKPTLRIGTFVLTIALLNGAVTTPADASLTGGFNSLAASPANMTRTDLFKPAAPTLASSLIQDVGAAQRINSAGRLRMLSQRITAAASNFASGVAPDQSKAALLAAQTEYNAILAALTNGDDSLGILGPETRRKTLAQITNVTTTWGLVDTALTSLLAGTDVTAQIASISANSDALLKAAIVLTSEISSEYSNPAEMTQAMALTIDLAGRQRMLTQKIAKEVSGVINNNPVIGDTTKLQATIAMYETTLAALHEGMPEAGIAPPTSAEIKAALEDASADWATIKVDLARVTGPGTLTADEQGALFDHLSTTMAKMNAITKMYTASASATL